MRRLSLIVVAALLAGCGTSATPTPTASLVPSSLASPSPGGTGAQPSTGIASQAASPSPAPSPSPAESPISPEPSTTPTVFPSPPVVALGTGTTIATPGGGKATVGVVDYRKKTSCGGQTPSSGNIYVAISVGYSADKGSLIYSPGDWIVVDPLQRIAGANPAVTCEQGTFTKGTLRQGQNNGGWLTFEVAKNAAHLDLYYFPEGGPKALWHLW